MGDDTRSLVAGGSTLLPTEGEWRTMAGVAEALVRSGLLPAHIKTPQAALAVMLKGRELGVPPMHALSNIVVVQGKPTCNAELMLALIYRDQGDEAVQIAETSAERCTLQYRRRGWKEAREHTFTLAEARTAGLADTPTWKKFPAAMLRARCISAVARMAFPDSIAGMYGYEELGVSVAVEDGQVVLAENAVESAGTTNGNGRSPEAEPATVKPPVAPAAARVAQATVTAPVKTPPAPAPNAKRQTPNADGEEWPRSAADWTRAQLRGRIQEGAGHKLEKGADWNALAASYGQPDIASYAEMTQAWLLGLYQAMRAADYAEMIAGATEEQAVTDLVSEALGERDRRQITSAAYSALCQGAEARKAELSAPLLSGAQGRAQVAS